MLSDYLTKAFTNGLSDLGIGQSTASDIGKVALPLLLSTGLGAAGSGIFGGNAGQGAGIGALSGILGLLAPGGALNSAPNAKQNSAATMPGATVGSPGWSVGAPGTPTSADATAGALSALSSSPQGPNQSATGALSSSPMANALAAFLTAGRFAAGQPQSGIPGGYANRPLQGQGYYMPHFAHGGALGHVFDTSHGDHFVRGGRGDGTSDSEPARLSDGEYVLTAADVSRIGQGSTSAGVKKLDQMRREIAQDAGAKQFQPRVKPPLSYIEKAGVRKAR